MKDLGRHPGEHEEYVLVVFPDLVDLAGRVAFQAGGQMHQTDVVRLEDFLQEARAIGFERKPEMDQGQIDRSAAQPEIVISIDLPRRVPLMENAPAVELEEIHDIHRGFPVAAM